MSGENLEWLFRDAQELTFDVGEKLQTALSELNDLVADATAEVFQLEQLAGEAELSRDGRLLFRIEQLARRKQKVGVEALIRGLLSSQLEKDLRRVNPSKSKELQQTVLQIAFGTILRLHVMRSLKEAQAMQNEVLRAYYTNRTLP